MIILGLYAGMKFTHFNKLFIIHNFGEMEINQVTSLGRAKDCLEDALLILNLDDGNHPSNLEANDEYCLSRLQKSGILVIEEGYIGFSSIMAQGYFIQWLFPKRSFTAPDSLNSLIIINVIEWNGGY